MPSLLVRPSYKDIYGTDINEEFPADIINQKFLRFELLSTREAVVNTLAEYDYKFGLDNREDFVRFIDDLNRDLFRSDYRELKKRFGLFTIYTRQNLLFLLKRLISDDAEASFGKVKVSNINQLSHFLLKLNCFEDNADDPTKEHDLESEETLLQLITAIFRTNLVNTKAHLSLSDLVRNYRLIEMLQLIAEGNSAAQLFKDKYELPVTAYIELAFLIYVFLNYRYSEGDFSNKINLIRDGFQNLPETYSMLKTFLDSMSSIGPYQFNKQETLYNFGRFWTAPVLKLSEDCYQVLDLGLLIEKNLRYPFLFFESPYLNDPQLKAVKEQLNLRSKALGTAYEDQIRELFFSIDEKSIETFDTYGNEIADLLLLEKNSLVVVEAKSGYIPIGKISGDISEEQIIDLLTKVGVEYPGQDEYLQLPKNKRKGLLQIIQTYFLIADENNKSSLPAQLRDSLSDVDTVYGVVVVQELAFAVSFLNYFLHLKNRKWLSQLNSDRRKFHIPFIISANDLNKVRNGECSWTETVCEYTNHLEQKGVLSFADFLDENYNYPAEISNEEYNRFFNEKIKRKYLNDDHALTK